MLPATNLLPKRCLDEFLVWALEESVDVSWMLHNRVSCIDEINILLTALYSVQTWEDLQPVWGMGLGVRMGLFGPVPIPAQGLLSKTTIALVWGWRAFAGCLALGSEDSSDELNFLGGELTYVLKLKNRTPAFASAVFSSTFG